MQITADTSQSVQQKMEKAKKLLIEIGLLDIEHADLFMKEFMQKRTIPSLLELTLIKTLDKGNYYIHSSLKQRERLLSTIEVAGLFKKTPDEPLSSTQQMLLKLGNEFKTAEVFESVLHNPAAKLALFRTFRVKQFLAKTRGGKFNFPENIDSVLQNPQEKFTLFASDCARQFLASKIEVAAEPTPEYDPAKSSHKRCEPANEMQHADISEAKRSKLAELPLTKRKP